MDARLARRLDQAQTIFESGEFLRAARILSSERSETLARGIDGVAEIDDLTMRMREHLTGRELEQFDAAFAGEKVSSSSTPSQIGDRGPALWITIGVIVLMVVGAFGPWAKALGTSVSGTDGSNDGWVIVVLAIVAGVLTWAYAYNGSWFVCALIALAGVGGVTVAIHDRHHVTHVSPLIQVGWGLNLDLVASAVLVVMALVLGGRSSPIDPSQEAARKPPIDHSGGERSAEPRDGAVRLEKLAELRERGLISADEYETKRAEILAEL